MSREIPSLGDALGMIELFGYTAAVEVADAMSKAADVKVTQIVKAGQGYLVVFVIGDTASVYQAIDTGVEVAEKRFGGADMNWVIPYPGTESLLYAYYWDKKWNKDKTQMI